MTGVGAANAERAVLRRLRPWLDRLPSTLTRVVRRILSRQVLLAASSLAFYGLISALPLLLISLELVDRVMGPDTVRQLAERLSGSDVRDAGQLLLDLSGGASSGWWIYVLALWPATAYGGGLRRALMEARGDTEALPGLKGRAIGLLLVLVLPAVVMLGIPLTFTLIRVGGQGLWGGAASIGLALGGGIVAGSLLNTLLYQGFSSEALDWRSTVGTAALVAAVTSVTSLGFVAYVRTTALEQRYGSGVLALLMLFGVWLLVVNVLLLAGYHAIVELEERDTPD